jgi:hypothetical protein
LNSSCRDEQSGPERERCFCRAAVEKGGAVTDLSATGASGNGCWGCNHERNGGTPLSTVEEAEAQRAVLRRIPALREYAESLGPEDMVRRSQANHSPQRYRAKPARRVERYEREGR